jgi:hypothetical protein
MNKEHATQSKQRYAERIQVANPPVAEVFNGQWPVILRKSNIHPTIGNIPQPVATSMLQRHVATIEKAATNNLSVRFLGYAPVFSDNFIHFERDTDWVVMNISADPFFTEIFKQSASYIPWKSHRANENVLYAPEPVIKDINAILNAGIDFMAMFIAHEVPKGSVQLGQRVQLSTLLPPPPPEMQAKLRIHQKTSKSFWVSVGALAIGIPIIGGIVATALAVLTAFFLRGLKNVTVNAAQEIEVWKAEVAQKRKIKEVTPAVKPKTPPIPISKSTPTFESVRPYDPVLFGVNFDEKWKINGQLVGMWYYVTHWYWPTIDE